MPITCVVAAVDGSPASLHALDWASDEADRRGVHLLVVHASLRERYELDADEEEDDPASEHALVHSMLADAVLRARARRPGIRVDTEIVPQETVPALLGLGPLSPLLVLGTHGLGGFPGLLLGSVSLRVAGRATYPVVVVRGAGQAQEPRHGRIVLGSGPDDRSDRATEFAIEEARLWQAELNLVRAWQAVPDKPGFPSVARARIGAERARAQLDAVPLPDALPMGVKVRRSASQGSPAAVLLRAGAVADLIVVGARRRRGLLGLELGAANHALLHHAPCPVAILPEQ
ncbi:universal stress protein [Streptacidiphilus sp. EB103A]|uniref:universal stress protein n=1 Tax=Streptacidiphilus sp. EB103A TaxID=3156275 RepID=UPI003513892D